MWNLPEKVYFGSLFLRRFLKYLLPLVLFFLGYGLMAAGNSSGPLGGLLGAALGIGIAFGYDRLVLKKKKTVYTIIGYGPSAAH